MAFYYYGAKHLLSKHYQPPRYSTIIEPFAGAAGYSCRWATPDTRVILYDLDERVVDTWHRLQAMSEQDLLAMQAIEGERTDDLLIAGSAGGGSLQTKNPTKISSRMVRAFESNRKRLLRLLPVIRHWEVILGDYRDAPDLDATWFIDPPYQSHLDYGNPRNGAGNCYPHGQAAIDFDELAAWCRSRPGQTIVCEQAPASWLPFQPFHKQTNLTGRARRTEVVWYSEPNHVVYPFQLTLQYG